MSAGYLFTELGFRVGFRSGFQHGFGVRIFQSPHAREPKTVLDSGFHAVDFRVPGTGFLVLFIGTWISDSSCWWDSGFQRPEFVFHKRICSGFRIPQAKLSILTWGDSSNRHHASEVKALLCITAHCCTLQFRYRCHLCGCGRLRVDETLPINK